MSKNIELLLNPYRQIEAWYLYHLYSLEYGEQCLAALQAVQDKMMEYDQINKKKYPPTVDEKNPYNFWIDIPITQFIDQMLSNLKEKIIYKRKHPRVAVSFISGLSDTFMRFKEERQHFFDAAQPEEIDPNAQGEINELLYKANNYDERLKRLRSFNGGHPILSILRDLNDNKVRDYLDVFAATETNDPQVQKCLLEPEVYPNYLMHQDETYPTDAPITYTGVWMPEHNYMPMFYYDTPDEELLETYHTQEKIILGPKEYGLIPPFNYETETRVSKGCIYSPTKWTLIEEIPPGTKGIPDNPLRLEDLRIPLHLKNQSVSAFGGEEATYNGMWYCPNMGNSPAAKQIFKKGDVLPEGISEKGAYVWYHTRSENELPTESYQQVVDRYKQQYEMIINK